MTVLSPWPRVEVMSLSEMNHSRSPEGPPGLFLKSYIIVLLRGGSAFNIVMILLSKVMYLVWIRPCIRKLLKGNNLEKLYRMWQLYEAQFWNSRGIYKWLCELGVWRAITRVPRRFPNTKLSWGVNTKIWRLWSFTQKLLCSAVFLLKKLLLNVVSKSFLYTISKQVKSILFESRCWYCNPVRAGSQYFSPYSRLLDFYQA